MTIDEIKKLLAYAEALFPTFEVKDPMTTAEVWHMELGDYSAREVMAALKIYVKTSNTAFAPSPSQLIGAMNSVRHNEELTEGEAWTMVRKAIGDSAYHAQERFDELPETVQKAVGSPTMLRQWGMTDSNEVNTVIMSNFQRAYKAELSRKEFNESIPSALSDVIKGITDKMSERIEANG